MPLPSRLRAAALALLLAAPAAAQPRSTLDALVDAEDARAATPAQLALLRAGLRDASPVVRRVAARALGRLERDALVPDLVAALDDRDAGVRAAAAEALIAATAHGDAPAARAAVLAHLAAERDPSASASLAEAAGWIAVADTASVRAAADALAARSDERAAHGAARGLYGLARQPAARGALPASAVARLSALVSRRRASSGRDDVETRELAALALVAAQQAPESVLATALDDDAPAVRTVAARAVATMRDSTAAERIARRALADPAAPVRTFAVGAFARRFAGRRGCAPYLAAAADLDLTVRLQALDALGTACAGVDSAVALLDRVAGSLGGSGSWHAPAHALVALAALDPVRARARLGAFERSTDFFVRDYAARAAARVRDTTALRRLAADAHANVRTAALAGLSETLGHAADDVYVAALGGADSQQLQTAAKALERSRDPRALPALLDALDRVSAARSETSRDARVALLERARELGDSSTVRRIARYVADFDTLVAARAADAIGAWTGRRPTPAPVPLARAPVPDAAERAALARARVTLEMADGGTIVIRLFPDDAPTNTARFARLARDGRLDGLTFHRVVAPRFVQGLSPGANEYAGWGPYTRDELARPNRRGAVGLSTRGRDTGDGQIFIDVGDVFELDHNYTILGEVVSGMEILDRMQEGARVRRATVR
ncbi:peptidyl-prolyl cis-trans isomerase cyclophilin type [Gemmatirosa kalamazoonensis]|uniref:peptidylprolyl isomerase n=1 Tax=Gemmatirosa kalamazoonensis TaxID=861299 RepID=W0RC09_9BACT|nr:peptidylprolyl isomerase [Gemmatirosa kalamazoonensis]AHG88316.1 peptidyl-prolyl cis-trans isomerase cyclophilin type [Gemmatirosa kalamazoonensis]